MTKTQHSGAGISGSNHLRLACRSWLALWPLVLGWKPEDKLTIAPRARQYTYSSPWLKKQWTLKEETLFFQCSPAYGSGSGTYNSLDWVDAGEAGRLGWVVGACGESWEAKIAAWLVNRVIWFTRAWLLSDRVWSCCPSNDPWLESAR